MKSGLILYLLYRGYQSGERSALWLGGLAFGLAVGAKSTVVLALPGVALALLIAWWRGGRKGFRRLFTWGLAGMVGFALLGAYGYIQNLAAFGDALNVAELTGGSGAGGAPTPRTVSLLSNSTLYLYQFADLTGLPAELAGPLLDFKARAANRLISLLDLPVVEGLASAQFSLTQVLRYPVLVFEDTAWFGLLAPLFLLPAFFYQMWQGLRRKEPLRLGLALMGAGFWLVYAAFFGWTPYKGRYFILTTAFLAPFMAFIYPAASPRGWKGRFTCALVWLAALISLGLAGFTLLNNSSKPLIGASAIWGRDEASLRTLNFGMMKPVIEMVEANLPPAAALATRLGGDDWDAVLFGRNFTRRIIQSDPYSTTLDLPALKQAGAGYLLVNASERPFLTMPDGLSFLGEAQGWTLYALDSPAPRQPHPAAAQLLLGASDPKQLFQVSPQLVGKVGITFFSSGQWEVESYEGAGALWLGEREIQGMRLTIWSEQAQKVSLAFDIQPGPGREDQERQVNFIFYHRQASRRLTEDSLREVRVISAPTRLAFTLNLQRGSNEVVVRILDAVTVRKQPNGDERALMALLRHLTIAAVP